MEAGLNVEGTWILNNPSLQNRLIDRLTRYGTFSLTQIVEAVFNGEGT
jgi:hypothetical protein